jgi:hypothetical protein
MTPVVRLEASERPSGRCYGCGEQSVCSLHVGHTLEQGAWKTGNSHQVALCGGCLLLLRDAVEHAL